MRRSWRTTTPRRCGPRTPTSCGPSEPSEERSAAPTRRRVAPPRRRPGRRPLRDRRRGLAPAARGRPRGEPAGQVEIWREIARANALYFNGTAFSTAMQRAIELAEDDDATADLYAELAFQTLVRAGMWGVAPPADLVERLDRPCARARAARFARPARRRSSRAATATTTSPPSSPPRPARSRSGWATPSSAPTPTTCSACGRSRHGEYDEALEWHGRRLSLVDAIDDPDHQADIYGNAIAPAVARGRLADARRHAAAHEQVTAQLSPHHRLHGVSAGLGARRARRRLGRSEPATAAGRGGSRRERGDAVCPQPALAARLCPRPSPARRRGGGAPARERSRGARHDGLRNRARCAARAARPRPRRPRSRRVAARRARRAPLELVLPQLDGHAPRRARGAGRPRRAWRPSRAACSSRAPTWSRSRCAPSASCARTPDCSSSAAGRFDALGLDWHAARTRTLLAGS